MVINPEDRTKFTEVEGKQIEDLEGRIDYALTKGMMDMLKNIYFDIPSGITSRVKKRIQEIYEEAGWVVKYESNQRNGESYRFSYKE